VATIYTAREREATTIPIAEILRDGEIDIYLNVQRRGFFDITFRGDRLTVTAGNYVGLIPLNERVFVDVVPKMPVLNLVRIVSAVSGDVAQVDMLEREYATSGVRPDAILEAIGDAFARALQRLEVRGLVKEYQRATSEGPALKGQIQFIPSLQRHWSRGRRHVAVCEYSDLSADTPENQLLRYACHLLLTHHRLAEVLTGSVRVLAQFEEYFASAGVTLARPTVREALVLSGNGSPEYGRAIRLATTILTERGVELPGGGGDLSLPSFLINMETLFESYARHVLRARLAAFTVLDGNNEGKQPLFDDRRSPSATPDIVVRDRSGAPTLIGEVKYKSDENRDDLNQVLGYALAYRVDKVVLILPVDASHPEGLAKVGRIANVSVYRYRIDLASDDLDSQESKFVDSVSELLSPTPRNRALSEPIDFGIDAL